MVFHQHVLWIFFSTNSDYHSYHTLNVDKLVTEIRNTVRSAHVFHHVSVSLWNSLPVGCLYFISIFHGISILRGRSPMLFFKIAQTSRGSKSVQCQKLGRCDDSSCSLGSFKFRSDCDCGACLDFGSH